MLQELMQELVKRAHSEKSVAYASLADGMQLLAYPLDERMVIGVGMEGVHAQRIDAARVLHRRSSDMARFGSWLPAQLKDGAWYVVKRLPAFHLDAGTVDERDLEAAAELLA